MAATIPPAIAATFDFFVAAEPDIAGDPGVLPPVLPTEPLPAVIEGAVAGLCVGVTTVTYWWVTATVEPSNTE